jgi:hypothetical protein
VDRQRWIKIKKREINMALAKTKKTKPALKEEFEDFRIRMLLLSVQEPPEPTPIVPTDDN